MKIKSPADKRRFPRINKELPFKVAANGYAFSTATQNLSCVGAYCQIKKYIPPFTKVKIKLALPIKTGRSSKSYSVECEGVIVRTEDKEKSGFNIAIFFNAINESQRKKISEYIDQFLPKNPPVSHSSPLARWEK
ncbi:MAG: PilZ domain-containing protein [Candidatus Omnitrophica bacterium]|nr:PilZ domain-containing protein [Candidatus Omnitrophota bacterium]